MQHPEWDSVVDLIAVRRAQPAIGAVPAGEARQARPAAARCRPDRRAGRSRAAARTTAAPTSAANRAELFGGGERRLERVADRRASAVAMRSRIALSLRYFSHVRRCAAGDGRRMSGERAIGSSTRRATSTRRRVDVAARGLPDAAHAAASARACGTSWRSSRRRPADARADRLLRQRRRPVLRF